MKFYLSRLLIVLSAVLVLGFAMPVFGATLGVNASQDTYKVGDQFNADIKIDSEDVGVNVAQATIKFSPAVLEVVEIDKTSSVFNFWIQDPTFNNDTGEITFVGGASSGLIGKSLQVLRVVFKAKGLGQTDIIFSDGAITASDGSGTNVLSAMNKIVLNIVSTTTESTSSVQLIERTPIQVAAVPSRPVVKIPLYPDPVAWYNTSSKFTANWELPNDISAVASILNKNPTTNPSDSAGIYNNETFSALSDGIWYLHVRFYNNMGWGTTRHYRIAIDTVPPSTFDVNFLDGLSADNPTPEVSYKVIDQLSGIDHYYIQIDSNEAFDTKEETYVLPVQFPGKHTIKVGAQDKAGNKVENITQFEILPIESPKIISVPSKVFVGEGGLIINGTSLASSSIILNVRDEKDNLTYFLTTSSDEKGNWAMKIDSPLKKGTYYVGVITRDNRGALSLEVKSDLIKVEERPIMVLWGFNITYAELMIFLVIILIGSYVFGWYSNNVINRQRQRKILISQRDVTASFSVIKKDIEKAMQSWDDKKIEEFEITELEFALKNINENIEKLQKYIISGIKDIGRK